MLTHDDVKRIYNTKKKTPKKKNLVRRVLSLEILRANTHTHTHTHTHKTGMGWKEGSGGGGGGNESTGSYNILHYWVTFHVSSTLACQFLLVAQFIETTTTDSVFHWYRSQRDVHVHLFCEFRMAFTWTKNVETSTQRDRECSSIVRNGLHLRENRRWRFFLHSCDLKWRSRWSKLIWCRG